MAGRGRGKTKEGTNATSALPEIFDECQRSFAAHKAAIKRMKKMLLDDEENFYETFVACVCKVLPTFKREPAVERLIQFIAKFAVSCSQESQNFTARFLKHLVSISDVKDKAIRFRCCQLLGNIMNALDEEAEIEYNVPIINCYIRLINQQWGAMGADSRKDIASHNGQNTNNTRRGCEQLSEATESA